MYVGLGIQPSYVAPAVRSPLTVPTFSPSSPDAALARVMQQQEQDLLAAQEAAYMNSPIAQPNAVVSAAPVATSTFSDWLQTGNNKYYALAAVAVLIYLLTRRRR